MSRREIVEKRRSVFSSAEKYNTFKVGDRRVHSPRLCVVCARPLTSLVLAEQRYVTSVSHVHAHFAGGITVDICSNINSCANRIEKLREESR
ncbi:hypothetical protein LD13_gp236 [Bacillus phage Bobb]|uniref:Uncharacterized protein n=1 Tax=Bacillus phage Bobb TaxID=1527469 RepID=A0A076G933_9CAUD|nr:hypothetical protein LD13_gp236 [Bacillus phage Bobb]AII28113.1 hypothetical protein [Bacillus phage Bobb]